jgi:hypothetical protein
MLVGSGHQSVGSLERYEYVVRESKQMTLIFPQKFCI